MNMTYHIGSEVLDIMSAFAPNRNRYIEKLIIKHLQLNVNSLPRSVVEFGAGKGEFINRLITLPNIELSAVENDPVYQRILSEKVKVFSTIEDIPPGIDAIYLIDVLEHLEDDRSYLKKFYDKLKPGGRIFIYVPARMELYSAFDESIGHFRRYTLKELKGKVVEAGYKIEKARYHELLGYFASAVNKNIYVNGKLNVSAVKMYDKFFVPMTNFIERFIRIPVGKSVYLSAIKQIA